MQNSNTEPRDIEARCKKRTKSSAHCKMQNENVKFKIPEILKSLSYGRKEKITEIYKEIYSSGESSDSSRSFQFEKTRRINQRALSKTEIPKEAKSKR